MHRVRDVIFARGVRITLNDAASGVVEEEVCPVNPASALRETLVFMHACSMQ
eukprot:SAG31_NODE_524_length_14529_cov_23.084130_6_plen_52_part_00